MSMQTVSQLLLAQGLSKVEVAKVNDFINSLSPLRKVLNDIFGCIPEQYTDKRNRDHLKIVVDMAHFMRLDPEGWGKVLAEIEAAKPRNLPPSV